MLGCNQTYIQPNANVVVTFSVSWDVIIIIITRLHIGAGVVRFRGHVAVFREAPWSSG